MKKIPLFVLILAVMLSIGGSCIFPMLTAQASSGAMQMGMDDGMAMTDMLGDDGVQSNHCLDQNSDGCGTDQNSLNSCLLSCGGSMSKAAVVKKTQDALGLQIFSQFSELFLSAVNDFKPTPKVFVGGGGQTDMLLSVAKKE